MTMKALFAQSGARAANDLRSQASPPISPDSACRATPGIAPRERRRSPTRPRILARAFERALGLDGEESDLDVAQHPA